MDHPLLAKVQAWQPATDKRPHSEWLNEQIAISEEIGGEYTTEEVLAAARKAIDEDVRKTSKDKGHIHAGG